MKRLRLGAVLHFLIAIGHIGCLFALDEAFEAYGIREIMHQMVSGHVWILYALTIGLVLAFCLAGLYALSATGDIRRLPLTRAAIITIVVLYSLRALAGGISCINDFTWLQCISSLVPAIIAWCYWPGVDFMKAWEMSVLNDYQYVTLRDRPEMKDMAATWFHGKWSVPKEAYLECMDAYLSGETEYGWYLCLDGSRIIGGMGVIENDFHDRKDLSPNVCAVYTEKEYRCQGIAGKLLNMVVEDMRSKKITPLYLVTNHTGFYERYGWEFLCMVQGNGESEMSRMYIHK